jgi:formylglycine-generating enzyme required for sulfatase activity
VTGLTLTPDGQAIAASYADGSARIWDLADPKPLVIREPGSPVLHAMAFSPDGKFLAGAGDDGEISLWDGGTRKPLPPMVGHGRPALCLAFVSLGDTELIVSGSQNGELRLRNLGDHADITTVPVSPTAVTALTGSASGLIVSGTDDDSGTILVGSIVSGTDDDFGTILLGSEPIGQLGSRLRSMALRPDGVILVVGGEDGLVGVWDGAKRDRLTLRKVHSGAVTAVSFDHTGRHVITASEDGSAKLWSYDDLENPAGRETASLFGHASANDRPNQPGAVTCAVFGPDGSTAATAGADGCVKLWMIAPARAHGIALRSYLEQGNGCYRFEPATQTIEVAHVPGATNARFLTVPDNPLTAVWTNPVADQAQRKVVVTSACAAENWMLALRVVESLPSHERGPLIQIVADALAKQRGAPDSFLGDAWPKARLDWIVREAGRAPWVTDPDPSSGTGFVNSSGMEFVWCPPGNFDMGSPDNERDRRPDETRHKVAVDEGFWIGKFEVTEAQWREVMRTEIRFGSSEGAFVPKSEVTWHDCVDFCDTLTKLEKGKGLLPEGWAYQLPTEVQWEYACRADNAAPFNFGHALNGVEANIDGTVPYGTEKKGQFLERVVAVGNYNYPPNAWGIHDMHGNVWEWCLDPYAYYDSESPVYLGHVLRGGGWDSAGRFARSANRERAMTWFSGRNTGFRVVLAVLTPSEASTK